MRCAVSSVHSLCEQARQGSLVNAACGLRRRGTQAASTWTCRTTSSDDQALTRLQLRQVLPRSQHHLCQQQWLCADRQQYWRAQIKAHNIHFAPASSQYAVKPLACIGQVFGQAHLAEDQEDHLAVALDAGRSKGEHFSPLVEFKFKCVT